MSYPEFVKKLDELHLKKRIRPPKIAPSRFYPMRIELETQELLADEFARFAESVANAAERRGGRPDFVAADGLDDLLELVSLPTREFREHAFEIALRVDRFNTLAFAEFSALVIGERYFPTGSRAEILSTWTENFVNQCKTVKEDMKQKSATILSGAVLQGKPLRQVMGELREQNEGMGRNKAELIARTEIGHLNSAIARRQQQSVGIEYYEWSATMDGRTRESHALLDGKICRWDKPDKYYTFENGEPVEHDRTQAMFKGAPGEDFQCRCTALPWLPEFADSYK